MVTDAMHAPPVLPSAPPRTDAEVRELLMDVRRHVAADVLVSESRQEAIAAAESRRDAWDAGLGLIERWICVTDRFRRLSLELLLQHGFPEWRRYGGRLDTDGRPTLGSGSPLAREILAEVIAAPGHFTYLDRTGRVRATFVTGDTGRYGHWQGMSLGGLHSGFVFSRLARRAAVGPWRSVLVPAGDGSSAFRTVNQTYDPIRTGYSPKRAEAFELASRIVPVLWQAAEQQASERITLKLDQFADALWSFSPLGWPDDCLDQLISSLEVVVGLSIQSEKFFKSGWCKQIEDCRPAILQWRLKARHLFKIHLSPEFRAFGQRWAATMVGPSRPNQP
jgi:hypothetical protein